MKLSERDKTIATKTAALVLGVREDKLNLSDRQLKGVLVAIETLRYSESNNYDLSRNIDMFKERIYSNDSFRVIGARYGISSSRVSQLYKKGIRALNTPSRLILIENGIDDNDVTSNKRVYEAANNLGIKVNYSSSNTSKKDMYNLDNIGLSSRTLNLLHRHELNTAGDILKFIENGESLRSINNFGPGCMQELSERLAEIGINISIYENSLEKICKCSEEVIDCDCCAQKITDISDRDRRFACNIILNVLGVCEDNISDRRVKGALVAVESLREYDDKGIDILRSRVEHNKTFVELGEQFSIKTSRAKNIIDFYFKKLHNYSFVKLMKDGIDDNEYVLDKDIYEAAVRLGLNVRLNDCITRNILIDELNLSSRAYNALRSAGLYTVSDIVDYLRDNINLTKVRNFGAECYKELVCKLKKLNVDIDSISTTSVSFMLTIEKNKLSEKMLVSAIDCNGNIIAEDKTTGKVIEELHKRAIDEYNNLAGEVRLEYYEEGDSE